METKDLMIGDWVLMPDLSYGRITQISEKSVETDNRRCLFAESTRPIKLNTTILSLIGFEPQKTGYMIGFFGQFVIGRTPTGEFYVICKIWRYGDEINRLSDLITKLVMRRNHLFNELKKIEEQEIEKCYNNNDITNDENMD